MGQQTGKISKTWEELMDETDKVLQWSSEILEQINNNIYDEDLFLMDYENDKIDAKVEKWIFNNKSQIESTLNKFSDATNESTNLINSRIAKIKEDIQHQMRKDYQKGYISLRKFMERVDNLGIEEHKIHSELQQLEIIYKENPKKYQENLKSLRFKVFKNLQAGEKMKLEEERLKYDFKTKVLRIDERNMKKCNKKIVNLVKKFETLTQK